MPNRKITEMLSAVKNSSTLSDSVTTSNRSSPSPVSQSTSVVIEIPHRPSKAFVFPKTKIGERTHSYQHTWFERFPWLHYDTM